MPLPPAGRKVLRMLIKRALSCVAVFLLGASPAMMVAQDTNTVLLNTAKAMGMENLKTISFSATGSSAGIGQNKNPKVAWPVARLKAYTRELDLEAGSWHAQMVEVRDPGDG